MEINILTDKDRLIANAIRAARLDLLATAGERVVLEQVGGCVRAEYQLMDIFDQAVLSVIDSLSAALQQETPRFDKDRFKGGPMTKQLDPEGPRNHQTAVHMSPSVLGRDDR